MKSPIALLVLATSVQAQGLREDDRYLDQNALMAALSGHSVEFFDGSIARYQTGGAYSYTYQPADPPFVGRYEATADSRICVTFDNGFDRCDTYVMAGERLVLITGDGVRFPAKAVDALPE